MFPYIDNWLSNKSVYCTYLLVTQYNMINWCYIVKYVNECEYIKETRIPFFYLFGKFQTVLLFLLHESFPILLADWLLN